MAPDEHPMVVAAAGAVVGAALGLGGSGLVYSALVPLLEEAGGLLEELQGLAWNLVPLSTITGLGAGWWGAQRWLRHRSG